MRAEADPAGAGSGARTGRSRPGFRREIAIGIECVRTGASSPGPRTGSRPWPALVDTHEPGVAAQEREAGT